MSKLKLSTIAVAIALSSTFSQASVVREDVDYQYFRNFGENRGQFQAGSVNIPIYDNKGNLLGTALPKDIPMPDFSAVESNRFLAGLVDLQYLSSVKHNSDAHFEGVKFGKNHSNSGISDFEYQMVNRHDHAALDYNTPRLHKMVTEVAPAELPQNFTAKDMVNGRYLAFARTGSGTQATQDGSNVVVRFNAYEFANGGTALKMQGVQGDVAFTMVGNVQKPETSYGPLVTYAAKGDSGSPVFGFDKDLKRWVLVGNMVQYYGYNYVRNNIMTTRNDFFKQNRIGDTGAIFNVKSAKPIYWEMSDRSGFSRIRSEVSRKDVEVRKGTDLNHGKDIIFKGRDLQLVLNENINQGAGGLYFYNSATVSGANNEITHVGSGIYVDEDQQVTWKVHNPKNDRLSKVGKGELIINGTGVNAGDLAVGDGVVRLNQQTDNKGNKQAFNTVTLASGRGAVILGDGNQLKSIDSVRFASQGGVLDVNGNSFTLSKVRHVDNGAKFINGDRKNAATFTLTGNNTFLGDFGTVPASQSFVTNAHLLKEVANGEATNIATQLSKDGTIHLLHNDNNHYQLTGNINTKGNVSVTGGTLTLRGQAVEYSDKIENNQFVGVKSETDWVNRYVTANQFQVNNQATLNFGRNLAEVNGTIIGTQQSTVNLGAISLSDTILNSLVPTKVNGDIRLSDTARLNVGKAHLKGVINAGRDTQITMDKNATITLTGDSQIGKLSMTNGAVVNLNPDNQFGRFNTLTISNELSGNGLFRFSTDLANLVGNKLVLQGKASGNYLVDIQDSGNEPDFRRLKSSQLGLIDVKQANQNVKFTLAKPYIEAGAYRYTLENYALSSQGLEDKISGKTTEVELPKLDSNYKAPDFATLNPVFTDKALDKKAKEVFTSSSNSTHTLTYEELLERLKGLEAIAVELDANGKAVAIVPNGTKYALDNLTQDQLNEIQKQANGEDLTKADPNSLIDHTPTPKELPETVLYDKESAKADGVLIEGETVPEIDTTIPPLVKADPVSETTKPTENTTSTLVPEIKKGEQKEVMSKYSNGAVSAATLNHRALSQMDSALNDHLLVTDKNHVWTTYKHSEAKSDNSLYRQDKLRDNLTQVGATWKIGENTLIGASLSLHRNATDMDSNIHYKQKARLGELFIRNAWSNGVFVIGQVGIGRIHQQFSDIKAARNLAKLGVTVGMKNAVNNWEVIPYAGVRWYQLKGNQFNLDGATVKQARENQVMAVAGVNVAYNLSISENVMLQPLMGLEYHTGTRSKSLTVNNAKFDYQFKQGVKIQAGFNVKADNVSLSITGEHTQERGFKRNNAIKASMLVTF